MNRKLTTEQKRNILQEIADGKRRPDDIDDGKKIVYICYHNHRTGLYEVGAYGEKDLHLTEQQFQAWQEYLRKKRKAGKAILVIMEYAAPNCDPIVDDGEEKPSWQDGSPVWWGMDKDVRDKLNEVCPDVLVNESKQAESIPEPSTKQEEPTQQPEEQPAEAKEEPVPEENKITIGRITGTAKVSVNAVDLDWIDIPIESRIDYMFPRR